MSDVAEKYTSKPVHFFFDARTPAPDKDAAGQIVISLSSDLSGYTCEVRGLTGFAAVEALNTVCAAIPPGELRQR